MSRLHRISRLVLISLGLVLLAGCTTNPSADLSAAPTSESAKTWAKADLLDLAAGAGSRAEETSVATAINVREATDLLGRNGDVTKTPASDALKTGVKARLIGGFYDGRVVWIVGVYPVDMPLLRGGSESSSGADTGREVNVFDAKTGEHLLTTITSGPPPWE